MFMLDSKRIKLYLHKKKRKYPAQMKTKQNIPIAKAVLRRKFVIHAYIKKRKSQTT